jgi:hypothetical protein
MAAGTGLSRPTINRIWRAFGLQPHRAESFKLSNDPQFIELVLAVIDLFVLDLGVVEGDDPAVERTPVIGSSSFPWMNSRPDESSARQARTDVINSTLDESDLRACKC